MELQNKNYFIKEGYVSREVPDYYFDDQGDIVCQPDVYVFTSYLADKFNCKYIIDIGSGNGDKIASFYPRLGIVGIDFGANLDVVRSKYPFGNWIEQNLDESFRLNIPENVLENSIIVCSDIIEHLTRPEYLLENLKNILDYAKLCILSTPERDLTRGKEDFGPPHNSTHVREWNIYEMEQLLRSYRFDIQHIGLTISDTKTYKKATMLAVLGNNVEQIQIPEVDWQVVR